MYEAEGVVIKLDGNDAFIRGQRKSSCCGCAKDGDQCGTASLLGFFARHAPLYRVRNDIGAKIGEQVVIGLPEGALLKGAAAIYLPALLFLIAGAVAGNLVGDTPDSREWFSVLGAVVGLAAGFFWSSRRSARMNAGGTYRPVVLSRRTNQFVVNLYGDHQ